MTESQTFQNIADAAVDYLLQSSPVRATQAGIHDYDAQLDRIDRASRAARNLQLGVFIDQLNRIDPTALSRDERFDLQILTGNLNAEVISDTVYRRWDRDPSLALEVALYGCLALVMRDFAPLEERIACLIGRVKSVPRLLDESKVNLGLQEDIPTVWAEMAEDLCASAGPFLQSLVDDIAKSSPQRDNLEVAVEAAKSAVSDYQTFLKSQLTRRSRGSYACGWPTFSALLRNLHGIETTAEELIAFGESEIIRVKSQIEEVAKTIHSEKTVPELLEEIKSTLPPVKSLLEVYRDYVKISEQFIRHNKLITLPDDIALEVIPTPEFVRHTFPYAAYSPPAPLDNSQRGQYWVTPIPADITPEDRALLQRNHNPYQAHLISLHEGFPGHHVQMTLAASLSSRVRKLFDSNVFLEGWALYCEEMMWEQGYFKDVRYRLMQLYLELWRACRVVIDVKLHTGLMSFTEAVNLLVETAQLDKLSAIAEVKRYSQSPTQPLSYLVGKRQILSLRSDCEKLWGDRFSLCEFHDRLLGLGSVPMNLARTALLEHL